MCRLAHTYVPICVTYLCSLVLIYLRYFWRISRSSESVEKTTQSVDINTRMICLFFFIFPFLCCPAVVDCCIRWEISGVAKHESFEVIPCPITRSQFKPGVDTCSFICLLFLFLDWPIFFIHLHSSCKL